MFLLVVTLTLAAARSSPGQATPFDKLDQHALKAPADVEKSLDTLAKYLAEPARSDRDKARVIFRWITDRIAYDAEGFFTGKYGDLRAEAVLGRRKAVCTGYANLFEALGKRIGLEVAIVHGYAKGVGYVPGQDLKTYGHSWNAVKIDGRWQLLDSTWGAGSLDGKAFDKEFKGYFFLVPPEQLIFSHFPDESKWQLLTPPVARDDFAKWPQLRFKLFDWGVAAADVKAKVADPGFRQFVETLNYEGPKVKLKVTPLERSLKAGGKYRFEVEAPANVEIAGFTGEKIVRFKRTGAVWQGEVTAAKGKLMLLGRVTGQGKQFAGILRYNVE
jgi:hypothetical protein